jgi:hypothetical protein
MHGRLSTTTILPAHRTGEYKGHQGSILQMMVLGDNLLALDDSNSMLVWKIGNYDEPEVWPMADMWPMASNL